MQHTSCMGTQTRAMPAQAPEAPPEVKEWGQNTVMGVLFGLVLGGGRQWLQDRRYGAPRPGVCL